MKKVLLMLVLAIASSSAMAVISYDQNVTPGVIFGSGNANGYFAVDDTTTDGLELGMRAKVRYQGIYNSDGLGTYTFANTVPNPAKPFYGVWNVEWSINTDANGNSGLMLNDYTYDMTITSSKGTLLTGFDVINASDYDHSIGDNTTTQLTDFIRTDAADYANLIDNYNVAQQSWQPVWFGIAFDPTDNETYDFTLSAYDGAALAAQTSITVITGTGAVVPAPGALLLAGIGTACVGRIRRFAM